jgi:hypothetical protein
MADEKEWLNRKDAARYLSSIGCPIAPQTLAKLASNNNSGKGPPFNRFRWNRVAYKRVELSLWAAQQTTRVA